MQQPPQKRLILAGDFSKPQRSGERPVRRRPKKREQAQEICLRGCT